MKMKRFVFTGTMALAVNWILAAEIMAQDEEEAAPAEQAVTDEAVTEEAANEDVAKEEKAAQPEPAKEESAKEKTVKEETKQDAKEKQSKKKITAVAETPPGMTYLSTGRYVASGLVGTIAGFGIGHIVQGSWTDSGWIFTLGEGTAMAAMVIASANMSAEDSSRYCDREGHDYNQEKCDDSRKKESETGHSGRVKVKPYWPGLALVGAGGFVGLRIWEIVNIWSAPRRINGRRYIEAASSWKWSIYPTPVNEYIGVGTMVAWRF